MPTEKSKKAKEKQEAEKSFERWKKGMGYEQDADGNLINRHTGAKTGLRVKRE